MGTRQMEMNLKAMTAMFMVMMTAGIVIAGSMAQCSGLEMLATVAGSGAVILFTTLVSSLRRRLVRVTA